MKGLDKDHRNSLKALKFFESLSSRRDLNSEKNLKRVKRWKVEL